MAHILDRLGGPDVGLSRRAAGQKGRLAPRRLEAHKCTSVYTVARACMRDMLLDPSIGEVAIQAVFIGALIGYSITTSS